MKYATGTKLICNDCYGFVIENFKLAGDICVEWENGMKASYDSEWLDENAQVVK